LSHVLAKAGARYARTEFGGDRSFGIGTNRIRRTSRYGPWPSPGRHQSSGCTAV